MELTKSTDQLKDIKYISMNTDLGKSMELLYTKIIYVIGKLQEI